MKKKILKILLILAVSVLIAYILYLIYDYAVECAIVRIKKEVHEGVRQSIKDTINPFKWFRRSK